MELKNESKTLFIPLLAKSIMSKKDLFLKDIKAEEIISYIENDNYLLKQSKWLSMFLSLRALIIDELTDEYLSKNKDAVVIHLGCGLDSRCFRINENFYKWYDIDYEDVIKIRKQFYNESESYKMLGYSITNYRWLDEIEIKDNILIVAEGLTMYLSRDEIKELLEQINNKFNKVHLLFDAYSKRGVKLSKVKNPVNQVDAKIKYGFNNYKEFIILNDNLNYLSTHLIQRKDNNLKGITKFIFNNLYCGKIAQSIYKIYQFKLSK